MVRISWSIGPVRSEEYTHPRKWQPKLVRPANFGPLGALKLRTWVSHMADLLEPVVDCDSVKDVALLKDALKYIQTGHYPAGI